MAKKKSKLKGNARTSAGSLNRQFHKLSASCIKADGSFVAATVNIHSVLARCFKLYLDLQRQPAILKKICKKEGVKPSPRKGDSKFTPFVKVLFRLDLPRPTDADKRRYQLAPGSMRNRVSEYAAVMDRLDTEYTSRPKDFQRQPEARFKAFIEKIGGVSGSVKARVEKNATRSGKPARNNNNYDDEVAKSKDWITANALATVEKTTIIGTASFFKQAGIRFTGAGLAACILSKGANGQINVLAANNNNDALQLIAEDEAAKLNKVPNLSLRLLGEVVATQSYPSEFCPEGSRADPAGRYRGWYEDVCAAQGDVQKGARRLVVRQDNILLSPTGTASGVVTLLKPAKGLLSKGDFDVFLDDEVHTLEDWVATKTIVARTATPSNSLGKPPTGHKDDRVLDVKNLATGKTCKLHFHHVGGASNDPKTSYQADLILSNFTPTWTFTAQRDWFQKLRDECLAEWFGITVAGNKLKRREYWVFNIAVTKTKFVIGYELDQTGKNPKDEIGLGGADSTAATLKGARAFFHVSAKDLAPALFNLADRDIDGSVKISGDDDMVLLEFRTAGQDEYLIAIPTATASDKGVKRATTQHMTAYPKAAV